ncbi:MAG: hypothetical protein FD165_2209 [Gammaproteobacteria bacterium]|nr:MAG: hypothetical protein FD165_2209 [Gammaproteobacteria bacterium]TND03267.1 MAG: hypothetical protein FD120_1940 [Gammaproteobacteria bacterium]
MARTVRGRCVISMDISLFERMSDFAWRINPSGNMRVPAIIYASEDLVRDMDDKVREQIMNVATLPGIVHAAYAMPDAHWGYGFPIGGVAAFDADDGGVISAGGVGFDISCGVRNLHTGLTLADLLPLRKELADALYTTIPAGLGSTGRVHLNKKQMNAMLEGGARWAVEQGYGTTDDLAHIEEYGCISGADPTQVSERAKKRQQDEMGTLGSGNHYVEVQHVDEIFDVSAATTFGLHTGDLIVSIHCGSRGLGHQIGTEFLRRMAIDAASYKLRLPDRELACAPILSPTGKDYLGAMRSAINCALANRQIITHLVREVFARLFPDNRLNLIYDVSHNTCKVEEHVVAGQRRRLFVHRKGATRAFGPGHSAIPEAYRAVGQPVLIGGTMGTASYILVGTEQSGHLSFGSACHGAGRAMSRRQANKQWQGRQVIDQLAAGGIIVCSPSTRGVAEEAPGAYKDVSAVVDATADAGLARKVARLRPLICIKG